MNPVITNTWSATAVLGKDPNQALERKTRL